MNKYTLSAENSAIMSTLLLIILLVTFNDMYRGLKDVSLGKQIITVVCYVSLIGFAIYEIKKGFFQKNEKE